MDLLEGPCGLSSSSSSSSSFLRLGGSSLRLPLHGGAGPTQRPKSRAKAPKKQAAVLKRILGQAVAFNRAKERQYMWRKKAKEEGEDPKKTWKLFRIWGQGLKKIDRVKAPTGKALEKDNGKSAESESKEVAEAVLQRLHAYREKLARRRAEGGHKRGDSLDVVNLVEDDMCEAGPSEPPIASKDIALKGSDVTKVAKKMEHELKEQAKKAKKALRLEKRRQKAEKKVKKKEKKERKKERRARKIQQLLENEVGLTADIQARIEALSISKATRAAGKGSEKVTTGGGGEEEVHILKANPNANANKRATPPRPPLRIEGPDASRKTLQNLPATLLRRSSVTLSPTQRKLGTHLGTGPGRQTKVPEAPHVKVVAVKETICLSSSEDEG